MSMNARLREERERLEMSQEDFAALAGVTRSPYSSWEAGKTSPTAVQLAALANAGADVLYILTGQRQTGDVQRALTRREAVLVDNYRNVSESQKDALDQVSAALAQSNRLAARKKGFINLAVALFMLALNGVFAICIWMQTTLIALLALLSQKPLVAILPIAMTLLGHWIWRRGLRKDVKNWTETVIIAWHKWRYGEAANDPFFEAA